jgi:hypothetical protein
MAGEGGARPLRIYARPNFVGALEIDRRLSGKPAMRQAADIIGQPLTLAVLERLERRADDLLWRTFGRIDAACEVGVDEARMEPHDLNASFGEFDAKAVGQPAFLIRVVHRASESVKSCFVRIASPPLTALDDKINEHFAAAGMASKSP